MLLRNEYVISLLGVVCTVCWKRFQSFGTGCSWLLQAEWSRMKTWSWSGNKDRCGGHRAMQWIYGEEQMQRQSHFCPRCFTPWLRWTIARFAIFSEVASLRDENASLGFWRGFSPYSSTSSEKWSAQSCFLGRKCFKGECFSSWGVWIKLIKQEWLRKFWNVSENVGEILKAQIHVASICKEWFERAGRKKQITEDRQLLRKRPSSLENHRAKE
jgi:hypothetical protein